MTAWPSKNYPAFNGAQTSNVEKIRPAFELNSSTILFASAVPSATSTGNLTLQDTDGDGAFTLRYDAGKYSKNLGSAVISYDDSKVILTDVPMVHIWLRKTAMVRMRNKLRMKQKFLQVV